VRAGFAPVALAGNILRLETAGLAGLAVVRGALAAHGAGASGPAA
jgi:16S rRNA U1498 N3-methylase RsmE